MRFGPLLKMGWVPLTVLATTAFGQPADRARVSVLAEKLSSPDTAIRLAAATELADLGPAASPAAPQLVGAMKDKDLGVRARVASALVGIGDQAIPALSAGLADPNVGADAALVLSKLGAPGLRALVDAVSQGAEAARSNAVAELGQLGAGSKRAIPLLMEILRSPEAPKRAAAAQALAKIEESTPTVVLPAVTAAIRDPDAHVRLGGVAAAGQLGGEGAPLLVERLDDSAADVKQAARDALIQMGAAALPAARAALGNATLALPAGAVLGRLGEPGTRALAEALASEGLAQRLAAATALAEVGPSVASATPALTKALQDPDASVRATVARALGQIGAPAASANPALVTALGDSSPLVRTAAAIALGQTDAVGHTSVPGLVKALDDSVPDVQRAAVEALHQMGTAAVPALLGALKDPKATRATEVLAMMGPGAIRELAFGLRSPEVAVRAGAAETFGRMGTAGSDALPLLIEALKDPAPEVRTAAAKALGLMAPNSTPAVPNLVALLHAEKERAVRLAMIVALGQLRATSAVSVLSNAMHDEDVDIRNAATNSRRLIEGH